jgi:uncharacterized protein DUF3857
MAKSPCLRWLPSNAAYGALASMRRPWWHAIRVAARRLIPLLPVLGLLWHCDATAQNANGPAVTIEFQQQHFAVETDGPFVLTQEERRLVEHERGIKSSAQQYLLYNASLETVEILEAYTQKPDARKLVVQPDHIRTQQEVRSFNAPMFQDLLYKIIIFPEVAVGDRLYWRLVRRRHTPLFPGHFMHAIYPQDVRYEEFRLVYDMPVPMSLNVDNVGFRQLPSSAVDGKMRSAWAYIPKPRPRTESGAVDYADYGDHLYVSTFQSHAEFAKAYESRAATQSVVTPAIKELVAQLLKNVESPLDKPVILAKSGQTDRAPATQPLKVETAIKIQVTEDGSATFTYQETQIGAAAEPTRSFVRTLAPAEQKTFISRLLRRESLKGAGRIDVGDLQGPSDTYQYGGTGEIENLIDLTGVAVFPTWTSFGAGIRQAVWSLDSEQKRNLPFLCFANEAEESTEIELPNDRTIAKLPRGMQLRTQYCDYESQYMQAGSTLLFHRRFKSKFPSAVCSSGSLEEIKPSLQAMRKNLASKVVLESEN